jgi:hypothetical protein
MNFDDKLERGRQVQFGTDGKPLQQFVDPAQRDRLLSE